MLTHHVLGPGSFWCTEPGIYLRGKDKIMNERIKRFTLIHNISKALYSPTFSLACSMSSSGSDGNIAVIHLCFPLLGRSTKKVFKAPSANTTSLDWSEHNVDTALTKCYSLRVWFQQDLVFELLAFTKLQVEDEAWDTMQLLTEILHFQLSDLGVYKHHELPCTVQKIILLIRSPAQSACLSFSTLITSFWIFKATVCFIWL